jgi:two-component system chemotaxis response regulator CheY
MRKISDTMAGILIIDDTPADLKRIHEILSSAGYVIAGLSRDGEEGVSLFREKNPDLVIIDLILTGINGIEVLRRIRSESPAARAILCTSAGQGSIIDLAMRTGADGYVVKPFDPEILVSAARRVLGSPFG